MIPPSLEKSLVFNLIPSSKDVLCQVWLKLVEIGPGERERGGERERERQLMHMMNRMYYLNCNELAASSLLVVHVTYSKCLIQYSFEDTCTVSCMTDWFLKGPTNTITCLANSTWSHPQLFCAPPNNPPHSVGSTFILCKISLKFGLETHCVHYIMSIETMTVTIV